MNDENAPVTDEEARALVALATELGTEPCPSLATVLLRRLRAAQELIEGMQAEGCAAMGVLENIFNGVTAQGIPADPTLKRVADVAARTLFEVPYCDHKDRGEKLRVTVGLFLRQFILARYGDNGQCGGVHIGHSLCAAIAAYDKQQEEQHEATH